MTKRYHERQPPVTITCETCGKSFTIYASSLRLGQHRGRFCSRKCNTAPHLRALNTRERNAELSRRTADKRSEILLRKYAEIRARNGKQPRVDYVYTRDGQAVHCRIAEQVLGRLLVSGEVVHHIDGNIQNNDPDNLAVLTRREHFKLHVRGEEVMQNGLCLSRS